MPSALTARFALAAFAYTLTACSSSSGPGTATEIKVAAASDLTHAFEKLGAEFTAKTSKKVTFSFGSSGLLAKQIAQGAPFDVFAAANVSFVDDAVSSGRCDASTKQLYARGKLAVWTKAGTKVQSLADLKSNAYTKVAIANPEHAPYGRAAREALQKAALWDDLKPKLVFGENVLQALQYAQTGNADAAIVSFSLVKNAPGETFEIAESEHAPLQQALVVCGTGPQKTVASEFATFVTSPRGRAVLSEFGFLAPANSPP
ncbi:MAG: molybdate ABC transporter substrate-binding protein [Polyangiaceae bacterium]|nr:molybdate ABC transporter substrate-binding protein [Polyangiaceae bacterium]